MRLLKQAPRGCPPWGGAAHPEPRRRAERRATPHCQSVTSTPLPLHPSFRPPRAGIHPRGGAAHPEPRRRVERMRDIISPTIPSPLFSLSSRGSALKVRRGGRDIALAHSHVCLLYSPTPSPNVTSAHCPTPTPPVYNVPCRSSSFPPSTSPAPLPRDGRQNFLPDQSNRHGF